MRNNTPTLADAINAICETQKQNPDCLTRYDLNRLETLKRDAHWLLSESYRGPMNSPRHHQVYDRIHASLRTLEKKCSDYHYRKKRREVMFREEMFREEMLRGEKFNPNHKPAGSPNGSGGEFDVAPGGGGSEDSSPSGGESVRKPSVGERIWQETFGSKSAAADEVPKPKPFKVSQASQYAKENIVDPKLHRFGNRQCAEKVREAVEHATGETMKRPESRHAKDYGDSLTGIGFKPVTNTQKGEGYPPENSYSPQEGDVIVIQRTSTSKEGHMAIYTGRDKNGNEVWVSDFIQERGPYPGRAYRDEKPSYTIYRHQNRE